MVMNDFEAEAEKILRRFSSRVSTHDVIKPSAFGQALKALTSLHNKSVAAIYEECNQKLEIALKAVGGKNAELEAELKNLDERLEQLTKEGEDE